MLSKLANGHIVYSLLFPVLLLTPLAASTQSVPDGPAAGTSTLYQGLETSGMQPEYNRHGEPQPVIEGINHRGHPQTYRSETIETVLKPRQQLEYMAKMKAGEVMIYSWEVDGRVYHDLHGHEDDVNPDIWIRYTDGEAPGRNGSIVAPYTGEHGWYWANLDSRPVTLRLRVSGYYTELYRIDL